MNDWITLPSASLIFVIVMAIAAVPLASTRQP
jgi:hypothetical protein